MKPRFKVIHIVLPSKHKSKRSGYNFEQIQKLPVDYTCIPMSKWSATERW
jgi:hypothetical protein